MTTVQKFGLSYENKAFLALEELGKSHGFEVEHNPWFKYNNGSYCSPDILLRSPSRIIVIEVKLAATPLALEKLESLYVPVVELALGLEAFPLVITRSLTAWKKGDPDLDKGLSFTSGFFETVNSFLPVYLWSGRGKIT